MVGCARRPRNPPCWGGTSLSKPHMYWYLFPTSPARGMLRACVGAAPQSLTWWGHRCQPLPTPCHLTHGLDFPLAEAEVHQGQQDGLGEWEQLLAQAL